MPPALPRIGDPPDSGPPPELLNAGEPEEAWLRQRRVGLFFVTCLTAIATSVFTSGIQAPWPWMDEGATYTALWRGWGQLLLLLRGPDAPLVPYYVIAKGWVLVV